MTFPTEPIVPLPTWATDAGAKKVDPGAIKRGEGWDVAGPGLQYGEAPPFPWVNNELFNNGTWATYFRDVINYIIQTNITPTQQIFLTGSGVYVLPTSPKKPIYIRVRMMGGGGGGSGSSTSVSQAQNGLVGGDSLFGSFLIASGGGGADYFSQRQGGFGGNASINSPATGLKINGQDGGSGMEINNSTSPTQFYLNSGSGGQNIFCGAGLGIGGAKTTGKDATPNTGAGGGGAGMITSPSETRYAGSGGGSGGYVDAIISNPNLTYNYEVGSFGLRGIAGVNGANGGNGANGIIIVDEYYN